MDSVKYSVLERLIIYMLLSDGLERFFLNFIAGNFYFDTTQSKTLIFYSLVLFDFLILRMPKIRITSTRSLVWGPLILIILMTIHGTAIGIFNGNDINLVVNDLFPAAFLLYSVHGVSTSNGGPLFVRPHSLRIINVIVIFIILSSVLANTAHGTAPIGLAGVSCGLYLCIVAAKFLFGGMKGFDISVAVLAIAISAQSLNRSTILFVIVIAIFIFLRNISNVKYWIAIIFIGSFGYMTLQYIVPEDSPLYQRILSDSSENDVGEGSVGERYAEAEAVEKFIANHSISAPIFGAGYGARYQVQHTWTYIESYGHAHFGWTLFYLRFGMVGYLYLFIWVLFIILSIIIGLRRGGEANKFCLLVGLISLIYINTWFVFNFYVLGLQFLNLSYVRFRND